LLDLYAICAETAILAELPQGHISPATLEQVAGIAPRYGVQFIEVQFYYLIVFIY
jgi:hypothetical protein